MQSSSPSSSSSSDSPKLRPSFVEVDHGLASLAAIEAPANYGNHHLIRHHSFCSRWTSYRSSGGSFRSLSGHSSGYNSPRSVSRFYDGRFEDAMQNQNPHFLEACALCRKPLGSNRDIFMYRGDTPFCSEECRQEQIEKDEAREKMESSKAMITTSKPSKSKNYRFRAGTVAA